MSYRDPFPLPPDAEYEKVWAAQRESRWGVSMSRLLGGVHSGLIGQALDPTQIHASFERFAAAESRPRASSRRPLPARPRPPQLVDAPPRRTRPPTGEPRARPAAVGPSGHPEPYRRVAPPPPPRREPASFMLPTAAFHSYLGHIPSYTDSWDDGAQPLDRPLSRARSRPAHGAAGRTRPGSAADLVGNTLTFRSVDAGEGLFRMGSSPDRRSLERDSSGLYAARAAPAGSLAKSSWTSDDGGRAPSYERAGSVFELRPLEGRPSSAHPQSTRQPASARPLRLTLEQQRELLRARGQLSERGRAVLDARLEAQGLTFLLDEALATTAHPAIEPTRASAVRSRQT